MSTSIAAECMCCYQRRSLFLRSIGTVVPCLLWLRLRQNGKYIYRERADAIIQQLSSENSIYFAVACVLGWDSRRRQQQQTNVLLVCWAGECVSLCLYLLHVHAQAHRADILLPHGMVCMVYGNGKCIIFAATACFHFNVQHNARWTCTRIRFAVDERISLSIVLNPILNAHFEQLHFSRISVF